MIFRALWAYCTVLTAQKALEPPDFTESGCSGVGRGEDIGRAWARTCNIRNSWKSCRSRFGASTFAAAPVPRDRAGIPALFDEDGYIVTNNRVIENVAIIVRLNGKSLMPRWWYRSSLILVLDRYERLPTLELASGDNIEWDSGCWRLVRRSVSTSP